MKVASYFKDVEDRSKYHFLDWIEKIGEALPREIGDATIFNGMGYNYEVVDGFDVSYCAMFCYPNKRPNGFVYTFLSDYRGYEKKVKNWISRVKPNLLCMLQELPPDLIDYANRNDCRVELMPWFVSTNPEYREKDIEGFSGGRIKPAHYPKRKAVYDYLAIKKFNGVVLSGSNTFGAYKYVGKNYHDTISRVKYYFSGGIYDSLIPPKYYEASNYGCTMVSHDMPFMERCGFVDGETYIKIDRLEDIDSILYTDKYLEIGKNAQKMIQEKHTAKVRAKQILEIYNEWKGL